MIYKFISPITVEENFLLKDTSVKQNYYIENIDLNLFKEIVYKFYEFNNHLPDNGLASFLKQTEYLYERIKLIQIKPILENEKIFCETTVLSDIELPEVQIGILKDFLQEIFSTYINEYMTINDILYYTDNNDIKEALNLQGLQYTLKLNFFNYNNFNIEEI